MGISEIWETAKNQIDPKENIDLINEQLTKSEKVTTSDKVSSTRLKEFLSYFRKFRRGRRNPAPGLIGLMIQSEMRIFMSFKKMT